MKMKVVKAGAERFDADTAGFYVVMAVEEDDLPLFQRMVGQEVDLEIRPTLRFSSGDHVVYRPTRKKGVIDGPTMIDGKLHWRLEDYTFCADDDLEPL